MLLATNRPLSFDARDASRSRRGPLNCVPAWLRLIIVLVLLACCMAAAGFCAHATSTEEKLTQAQIYNQQAQSNEKQTRSFWRKAKDNLPALGAILGAVITASVAIVFMSFNYCAQRRLPTAN